MQTAPAAPAHWLWSPPAAPFPLYALQSPAAAAPQPYAGHTQSHQRKLHILVTTSTVATLGCRT